MMLLLMFLITSDQNVSEAENRSCIHEYEENIASIQQDSLKSFKKFRNAALTKSA